MGRDFDLGGPPPTEEAQEEAVEEKVIDKAPAPPKGRKPKAEVKDASRRGKGR